MAEQLRLSDGELYIPSLELASTVEKLGTELKSIYKESDEIQAIIVMQGAMFFATELTRTMDRYLGLKLDTLRTESYAGVDAGDIIWRYFSDDSPKDRHVLIIEDILDRGTSLAEITRKVADYDPASLHTVVLMEKPECRQPKTVIEGEAPIVGMRIADEYVVGHGFDYKGRFRHLPHVSVAEQLEDGSYIPAVLVEPTDTTA